MGGLFVSLLYLVSENEPPVEVVDVPNRITQDARLGN